MSRGLAALALEVVFGGLAFGYRSWVHWRRTGSTGFIRPRAGAPAIELVAATLFLAALVLLVGAAVADLTGFDRIDALDDTWSAVAGTLLGVAGVALTVVAQFAMGDSWRIGVDDAARTDLVTGGAFARVRNPIYSAMVVASVGLVLLVPNLLSISAFLTLVVGLELQVRAVEEPYLQRTHGDAYRRYLSHVGRFVPGIGLERAT